MQLVNIYTRTTHQYADGWRHLDNDKFVAAVKVTPRKRVKEGNGYDEGGVYVQYARAPSGVNIDRLMWGLRETMGGSNCRHEHDCCGCATFHVGVKHVGSRRLVIHTRVSYNY